MKIDSQTKPTNLPCVVCIIPHVSFFNITEHHTHVVEYQPCSSSLFYLAL